MKLCKEQEICKPLTCRVPCPIGEELRNLSKSSKCGEVCLWIKNGIENGTSPTPCKQICPIGDIIVDFKK